MARQGRWPVGELGAAHGAGPASGQHRPGGSGDVHQEAGPARLAPGARRPGRGRLDGEREDGRGLDAPAGPGRAEDQAPRRIDEAGQDQGAVPGPDPPGLHRRTSEHQAGRGPDRDPHRRRARRAGSEAVPGDRDRPVLRRLLGAATGLHPDAELACAAIKMAVATRGGADAVGGPNWRQDDSQKVIFHTDRGSTYTANSFTRLCRRLGVRQSMGRVGSCFDNAAAEAFFSSLEWEVLSRNIFDSTRGAQAVVLDWCYGFYNHERRHSSANMMSPVNYENTTAPDREAA
nr:DDE-type integrase/transposase/recombinase [Phycicoccus sp. CSK15P-2]